MTNLMHRLEYKLHDRGVRIRTRLVAIVPLTIPAVATMVSKQALKEEGATRRTCPGEPNPMKAADTSATGTWLSFVMNRVCDRLVER